MPRASLSLTIAITMRRGEHSILRLRKRRLQPRHATFMVQIWCGLPVFASSRDNAYSPASVDIRMRLKQLTYRL
ncbi:hypothetical protein XocBAI20_21300 [Xanthomonas oryzae pv. oryzicola]|nr:hypothetical protein XocBAI20_21300 [Xanthomonas oryzae pv. oryzicola]